MMRSDQRSSARGRGLVALLAGTLPLACVSDEATEVASSALVADVNLSLDWDQFLARSDLWWDTMPSSWSDGVFTGNGLLGTMFWQSGNAMRFEISRTDVYDHRNADYEVMVSRARLPNGYFTLGYAGTAATGGNLRVDLWNAEARGTIKTSVGSIGIRTFTHAIDKVIVIELSPTGGETASSWTWTARECKTSRGGLPADYVSYPAQTQTTVAGVNVSVQSMPESTSYNTEGRGVGQFATAWKIVSGPNNKKTIYISEGFSYPGTTAQSEAVNAVNAALARSMTSLESSHRTWWHNFYRKSFVSMPHAKAESFYWAQMYKMASATRADRPIMDLLGPWWDVTSWPGIWWNLNTALAYSPFFVSNHAEEASSLINTLEARTSSLASNASPYSADSYAVFRATGVDLTTEYFPGEIANLAYALNTVWDQYRHTMDTALLQRLFPLLKGAFNYLWHKSRKDGSGVIHVDNTLSPEYPGATNVNDANYTLSLFKWVAKATIEANNRLGLSDPIVTNCQDVVQNLAPYPTNSNGFMIGASFPFAQSHRHWSHMFMIYPLFEYTWDNPAQVGVIDTSVNHWNSLSTSFRGYSWVAGMTFASMKRDGTTALSRLNTFLNGQPTPNTMYRESSPVIETPLYFARAAQEMMLMSYDGVIRVFPGAPPNWSDVAFDRFRAEGAFLVSAKRQAGVTKFVRVESLAGEPCKVKHGMSGTVQTHGNRSFAVTDLGGGTVEVDLQQGEFVILYTDATLPDLSIGQVAVPDRVNFWGANTTAAPVIADTDLVEAEDASLSGAIAVHAAGSGASGDGWAEYVNAAGGSVSWNAAVAVGGKHTLAFRYSNQTMSTLPLRIELNGGIVHSALAFQPTGSWSSWDVATVDVFLPAGSVTVTATSTGAGGAHLDNLEVIPLPWTASDIGAVAAAGSSALSTGTLTVNGSGADIYGTADEFHFVYQNVTGDGTITARVASLTNPHSWTKAAVIMRDGTAANAVNVASVVSPTSTNKYRLQYRSAAGGTTTSVAGGTASAIPVYLRVTRAGNAFAAFYSTDGTSFTQIGTTQTIAMPSTIAVGIGVTSHLDGTLATGVFDNLSITAPICTPESDGAFCSRLGNNCGTVSGTDNCGASRTVSSCGTCTSPETCGGGTPNVCGTSQGPYGGTAWAIPGTVHAENYDTGGQGIGYNDATPTDNTLNAYRDSASEGVDVESGKCGTGCFSIGAAAAGEWVEYTVNVGTAGALTLDMRVAATAARSSTIQIDGVAVGTVSVPSTGSYSTFQTTTPVSIGTVTTGLHVVRVGIDNGPFNLDWVRFSAAGP